MAEILGFVSSVITIVEVAGKLGKSTIRLKRLWDQVQDVPMSIGRCIEELEHLAPVIKDMDIQIRQTRDMVQHYSAVQLSVEYSRKAMEALETLVKDMEGQIASSRKSKKLLAQLKVRLKRDVIEEHQQRLQSALGLLSLSQRTYQIAQQSIIISKLQATTEKEPVDAPRASLSEQDCPPSELEAKLVLDVEASQHSQGLNNSRSGRGWWPTANSIPWKPAGLLGVFTYQMEEQAGEEEPDLDSGPTKVHQARLQLPYWMTQKAWDLQAYRAYDGWRFHFKSWNTRPDNSDVFRFVRNGNVDLLLEAFKNNQASLYDRTPDGYTLIELAASRGNFSLAKRLYALGLKTTELGQELILVLYLVIWQGSASDITEAAELVQIREADADLTLSLGTEDYLKTLELSYFFWGIPGLDGVLSLPPNVSMMLDICWSWVDPVAPLQMLEKGKPLPTLFGFRKDTKKGLYGFAWQYLHALLNDWQAEINHCRRLARLMLAGVASQDIAVPWIDTCNLSLLCTLLTETWRRQFPLRAFERWVSKAVSMWLEDLYEAGVDLEEYIQCEMRAARFESDVASIAILKPGTRLRDSGPSLVIIAHGQHPEDWAVEWDPCIEELSGEFWGVITSLPPLPGAWIDDAEDDYARFCWCHMQEYSTCVTASFRLPHEGNRIFGPLPPSRMRGIHRCAAFQQSQ